MNLSSSENRRYPRRHAFSRVFSLWCRVTIIVALIGCGSGGGSDRSETEQPRTSPKCTDESCQKSATGVACVDNAVNIANITEEQALRLCRSSGRDDLYICYINAVKIGNLSAEDSISLCDQNNTNNAYLCYVNGVNLAKLSHNQSLALCDNKATDEGYLCITNAKAKINGISVDQTVTLCKNGAAPDAYTCVRNHQTQSGLSIDEAVSLCTIVIGN